MRQADENTLIVTPNRAFGDGTHPTTKLGLQLLTETAKYGPIGRVLDVGTGTGILALAALRLGASLVVAIDLDAQVTYQVQRSNSNKPLIVVQGDGGRPFRPSCFDVVLANLITPLLIERSVELRTLCTPGATLILSGLLVYDIESVSRAYAAGTIESRLAGEWAALRVSLS